MTKEQVESTGNMSTSIKIGLIAVFIAVVYFVNIYMTGLVNVANKEQPLFSITSPDGKHKIVLKEETLNTGVLFLDNKGVLHYIDSEGKQYQMEPIVKDGPPKVEPKVGMQPR